MGAVIPPAPHPDAAAYPHGMVIRPPELDPGIRLGSDRAPTLPGPTGSLSKRLADTLDRGVGLGVKALAELLAPPRSI